MKLTPQQRIQIGREMENKMSLGFTLAMKFFDENIDKQLDETKKEFEGTINSVAEQISSEKYDEANQMFDKLLNELSDKKKEEFQSILNDMDAEIKRLALTVKDGVDGKDGLDGVGKEGPKGKDGINGRDGKDGLAGKDGKDGKDGSPDNPQEIANKINTLEGVIDPKSIKGYNQDIDGLKRAIRDKRVGGSAGGGGMGNWIHQTTAISSATTTVSLVSEPAAGGNAILVRYQGQLLAHGVQYSISGKDITLLFTPADATFLEVTYVRS